MFGAAFKRLKSNPTLALFDDIFSCAAKGVQFSDSDESQPELGIDKGRDATKLSGLDMRTTSGVASESTFGPTTAAMQQPSSWKARSRR